MLLRTPYYYSDFHCIADKCTDCCCIGWEIDIDKAALEKYSKVTNEFSTRLKSGISLSGTPHFILDKEERCPFLNSEGLCDIYINLGEEALCHICAQHPRYYEWYGDIKEGGIGICCPEAARLVLTCGKPFSCYDTPIPYEDSRDCHKEFYCYLSDVRQNIIEHLNNKSLPLKERLKNVLSYAHIMQERYDSFDTRAYDINEAPNPESFGTTGEEYRGIIDFFARSLEFMGDADIFETLSRDLDAVVKNSDAFFRSYPKAYDYLENLAVYFIWRHFLKGVFEDEFYSRAAFSVISCAVCGLLFIKHFSDNSGFNEKAAVNTAVYYSKQVEYSEENLERLFDAFYDNAYFSFENMLNLLENL